MRQFDHATSTNGKHVMLVEEENEYSIKEDAPAI